MDNLRSSMGYFFGTNARNRLGLSYMIAWRVSSLTPACRSFGMNTVSEVAAARDNRQPGAGRQLFQELEIATHVVVPAVDDAGDAVLRGALRFLDHQIQIFGQGRRRRRCVRRRRRDGRQIDREVLV